MGRGVNPPPQLGQTLPRIDSTHPAQNVHSNVQIRASRESGGSGRVQCSQVGRNARQVSTSKSSAVMLYLRQMSSFVGGMIVEGRGELWRGSEIYGGCGG